MVPWFTDHSVLVCLKNYEQPVRIYPGKILDILPGMRLDAALGVSPRQ